MLFAREEYHGIYRRSKVVLWPKIRRVGPTWQADRPCNFAGRTSFLLAPPFPHWILLLSTYFDTWWERVLEMCQHMVGRCPHLGSVELVLYATSFPHIILSVTMPYFRHNNDMHGFWSIWCFSIIRCSWNSRSTKLMELVSNRHISSISWIKCRYVGGKYMHFMTTNIGHMDGRPVIHHLQTDSIKSVEAPLHLYIEILMVELTHTTLFL
jgi:hypothetical protein